MTRDDERTARATLASLVDLPDADIHQAIRARGAVTVVDELATGHSPLRRAAAYAARLAVIDAEAADRAQRSGARVVIPGDREWPSGLDDLADRAPLALWVRGPAQLDAMAVAPSVAIVGARAATTYGEHVAVDFAADLAARGWWVVSGGAYGIDAAAHRGALAAGGLTLAVLANGVDLAYPRGNDALLARIGDEGAIVTELPPGRTPTRAGFLARNRLIAALAQVTVVVEAASRSGTASTVARAVELGREVCGVPGPVTSATSTGVHELLRDGATLVTEPGHVVEVMEPFLMATSLTAGPHAPEAQGPSRSSLSPDDQALLDAFPARRSVNVDTVAVTAGRPAPGVLVALGLLEADGWVERVPEGYRLTAQARTR